MLVFPRSPGFKYCKLVALERASNQKVLLYCIRKHYPVASIVKTHPSAQKRERTDVGFWTGINKGEARKPFLKWLPCFSISQNLKLQLHWIDTAISHWEHENWVSCLIVTIFNFFYFWCVTIKKIIFAIFWKMNI